MAPFLKNFLELARRHSTVAISMRLYNAPHIPPPPPRKLSHSNAMLLKLTLKFTIWGPQAHYMADDFFIPNPPLVSHNVTVVLLTEIIISRCSLIL